MTYVSGTGTNTFVFTSALPVLAVDTPKLTYSEGDFIDGSGSGLGGLSGFAMTNNSTQVSTPHTTTVTTAGAGTFTAPTNLAGTLQLEGYGGGEKSLPGDSLQSQPGGGGGAYSKVNAFAAIPGTVYNYVVAAGGTASAGQAGGNTTFNVTTMVAVGGHDSFGGSASDCTGDVTHSGGDGGASRSLTGGGGGSSASSAADGGAGAQGNGTNIGGLGGTVSGGGSGGAGGNGTGNGVAGSAPGGGGGGASKTIAFTGGNGGDGKLIVTYATRT
jgi:hypothetical protein